MRRSTNWFNAAGLLGWIALCLAVAGMGGWLTMLGMPDWYDSLIKPTWNPPNWIFGPVWTALYVMMALAAWLIWRRHGWEGAPLPLAFFLVQLTLNLAWSGIFFALRSPGWGAVEIVALWVAILGTLVSFWPYHRLAAILLVPYLAWVSFASVLNVALWRLNS
ncbi:MAG: tryptophan-rich sensory protein [Planctomycetaceae bacterium]|nr:tryptophan-rich sensory protein [Planctomycetaceae bacterium]